ncbi:helix-turn-helix transcriptional regulator [Aquamicrobium sp. LC103]|uniref:ArsR/SmtB family transcription factor n=1 Tax=Aquamicrobium sp. LC103 TaxID=1120658 RepID=UPI00063E76E9|nr:helix-turn-helix transcriptional regulator [Aquamicrobium sp. LC103]TKT69126.1 helix-turn-helix transcriptional regulator [Aquamicrobium sp. LC103]
MKDGPDISRIATLVGDPARANMLAALMDGGALTASELALEAGVTLQTASSHLAKLGDGGLVTVTRQGRHRYYALKGTEVASMLEAIMGVAAAVGPKRTRPGPRDTALREARICYDHLAGDRGVALYDHLRRRGYVCEDGDALSLGEGGRAWFEDFGIDFGALAASRRPLCRACLDWSVRRSHLAGALGAAMLDRIIARRWARRDKNSRAIVFTPPGKRAFEELLRG